MQLDKMHRLLGLAKRAHMVTVGSGGVETSIRSGNCCLAIITQDASDNTKKRMRERCSFYNVALIECGTKESFGRVTGYDESAVIAVTDKGFAKAIYNSFLEIYGGGIIE